MLSLIKNLFTHDKTPDLNNANTYKILLSGIKTSFLRAKETYKFDESHNDKTEFDINDKSTFDNIYNDKKYPALNKIKVCSVYSGYLDFEHGTLSTNISIQTSNEYSNLFNPGELEEKVKEFLDLYYGPNSLKGHRGRRFECPLFWEIKKYNDIQYIYFFVNELWNTLGTHHFILPIRKDCYIDIFFKIISMDYDSDTENEFEEYINSFMSNLIFNFDEQYEIEKSQSSKTNSNIHYSSHIEPLEWNIYDTEPTKFYRKQEIEYLEDRLEQIKLAIDNGLPKYSYLSPSENHPEIVESNFNYEKERDYLINKKKSLFESTLYKMDPNKKIKIKQSM